MHKLTEEGKQLLREVAQDAAARPEHFNMGYILKNLSDLRDTAKVIENGDFACGAVGCLVGFIAVRQTFAPTTNYTSREEWDNLVATAIHTLSEEWDEELSLLFNLYPTEVGDSDSGITSENVVECIEQFIESGIDCLLDRFDKDKDEQLPLIDGETYENALILTAGR